MRIRRYRSGYDLFTGGPGTGIGNVGGYTAQEKIRILQDNADLSLQVPRSQRLYSDPVESHRARVGGIQSGDQIDYG